MMMNPSPSPCTNTQSTYLVGLAALLPLGCLGAPAGQLHQLCLVVLQTLCSEPLRSAGLG